MRDTFSYTLHEVAKKIPNIFITVADISPAASMAPFREEFPDRFLNVGVSEQSMISLSTGLALRGCQTFAYTIAQDRQHDLNSKFKLNRFNTGHLIDEKGVGTKTWIG